MKINKNNIKYINIYTHFGSEIKIEYIYKILKKSKST